MNTHRRAKMRRAGWTAVDLLATLSAGVLALSVAIPLISAARWQSQRVTSKDQLARLGRAVETYRADHEAYPGYFPRASWGDTRFRARFNGNENLLLSLMGGVVERDEAQAPYQPIATMGSRVVDLKRITPAEGGAAYGAYYQPRPGELGPIRGVWQGPDNDMPELLDAASGWPLMYLRPQAGGRVPISFTVGGQGVFSNMPNFNLALALHLTDADGRRLWQAHSLVGWHAYGTRHARIADANLAMLLIDPAHSDLDAGDSPNRANDADDAVRDAGALLVAPGWDGLFLSRRQLRSGGRLIRRPDELEGFDDVWHWTDER